MASFVLSFFPLDVLDGIWDLIESVSEGFLTYSSYETWLKLAQWFPRRRCLNMWTTDEDRRQTPAYIISSCLSLWLM